MFDPAEHDLVIKALTSGLSNCVEWVDPKSLARINCDPELRGLTTIFIRKEVLAFVVGGGTVEQVIEMRPEYAHRRFYYKVILPIVGFQHGIFVEMELEENTDPEVPCVYLLNAHPQRK